MLPGVVVTALTRNPNVGMIFSGMMEGAQISGDITQQIADKTGDWNKAAIAGREAFIKNIPTYFLEAPIHRAVAGMAGKNVLSAVGQSFLGEGAQEWLQTGAIELPATEGMSIWQGMKDPRAAEAGIAGGVMGAAMGGGGIAANSKTTATQAPVIHPAANTIFNTVINPRAQVLTGTVMRFGREGAIGGAQMESLGQPEAVLNANVGEIEMIADAVQDAQTIGLNEGQTQVFVAKSQEVKGLQEQRVAVKDPVLAEIIDQKIADAKREMADVVNGKMPIATIEMPAGVMMSAEVPKIGELITIPEIREGIKNGAIRIVTTDENLNTQVDEIVKENEQPNVPQETTPIPYDDIADALYDALPNASGLYGRMLENVVNPDQQQFVVDAVIDQYNSDFEAASARYGEKITKAVEPYLSKEEVKTKIGDKLETPKGEGTVDRINKNGAIILKMKDGSTMMYTPDLWKNKKEEKSIIEKTESSDVKTIEDAIGKYEQVEGYTFDDMVNDIESISDDPKIIDAVDKYRKEQQEDKSLSGRGDMDAAEKSFLSVVSSELKTPNNETQKEEGRQEGLLTPATETQPSQKAAVTPVKITSPLSFLNSKEIKGKTVAMPVTVKSTGKKTTKKMDAELVQNDIKARYKELVQLLNCVG
jgi:hypothetical protein